MPPSTASPVAPHPASPDAPHDAPPAVDLEIAVQDPAGARVAADVGARRVELCAALGATGGITPGAGLLRGVLDQAVRDAEADGGPGVEVHVLVRPRAGGFVLSTGELEVHLHEVRAALDAGATGVVVGALTASGEVDRAALDLLVEAADGAEVTFHRAVDLAADPVRAVEALVAAGVSRVLTSGGAPRAVDGTAVLRAMVEAGRDGGVEVMAGGGVTAEHVPALVAAGVHAVHLSARRTVPDDGGPGGGGTAGREETDAGLAAAAAAALRRAASVHAVAGVPPAG